MIIEHQTETQQGKFPALHPYPRGNGASDVHEIVVPSRDPSADCPIGIQFGSTKYSWPYEVRVGTEKQEFIARIAHDYEPVHGEPDCYIFLLGAMRVHGPEGHLYTPNGAFRKALLAMLLTAKDGVRSRAWLQAMLWPTRDRSKAAASLRTAIFTLRKELGPIADRVLRVGAEDVALRLDRIWTDVDAIARSQRPPPPSADFLEGLDLPADDAEEFEEWLRLERMHRSIEPEGTPALATPALTMRVAAKTETPGLILMRSSLGQDTIDATMTADAALGVIAENLREMLGARIFDYRNALMGAFGEPEEAPPGYVLDARMRNFKDGMMIQLCVRRTHDEELLWTQDASGAGGAGLGTPELTGFVAQATERLAAIMSRPASQVETQARVPYHVLNQMFRLEANALNNVEATLRAAYLAHQDPIPLSLLAYVETFRHGESWSRKQLVDASMIHEMVREHLSFGSYHGLAMSSAGHALGMLTPEVELAGETLRRAVELSPMQAFCWDHLALHLMQIGRLNEATHASERALALGAFSPLCYAYETTRCLIASAAGDYETVVLYGKRALARQPEFSAALKYTASALGQLERPAEAAPLAARILGRAPEFSATTFLRDGPLSRQSVDHKALAEGLIKVGL